jgi:hypothetical protein
MKNSESRCTAYHEAAHAVIYLHFGIDIEQVTLCPDEAGLCSVSDNLPPSEGYVIAILAGSEADKLLLADDPNALCMRGNGWKGDFERAAEVFRCLRCGGGIEDAREEAARLVKEMWQVIRSLAELWIQASEENFAEGDPQYIMNGHEVKSLVSRFLADARDIAE